MTARPRILMFGWEFPPFNSGGLGVACEALVKALFQEGVRVVFVLPRTLPCQSPFCKIIFASESAGAASSILISPYITSKAFEDLAKGHTRESFGGLSLFDEVAAYAQAAVQIAKRETFDIIHAHDWLSFPAGLKAKQISQRPLIVHIHATEFDRTGGLGVNQTVFEIEKQALEQADRVVVVSNFTKEKLIRHYGIASEKIRVVYNAALSDDEIMPQARLTTLPIKKKSKVVLFLGRITLQKGPDYFLQAAKRVLESALDVFFIIVGSGDMEAQIIRQAAELNIADRVIFTGFLRGDELRQIYQTADIYVLSSVSEPFGLTALEALKHQTPVLISKQSGVSELLNHCLKVDFWDTEEMANKILAVLKYSELQQALKENGSKEARGLTWQNSARKCLEVYQEVLC